MKTANDKLCLVFSDVVEALSDDAIIVYVRVAAMRNQGINSIDYVRDSLGWLDSRWKRAWMEVMGNSDHVKNLHEIGDPSVFELTEDVARELFRKVDAVKNTGRIQFTVIDGRRGQS